MVATVAGIDGSHLKFERTDRSGICTSISTGMFTGRRSQAHDGRVEYSEWFNTEDDLRDSMRGTQRNIGKRDYCEVKMVPCLDPACDVDQKPRVISTL